MLQGTYNERRTSVRRKVDDPSIDVLCGDGASWDFIQNNTAQAQ